MSAIIDSHCHLDFEQFDADREAVMTRAQQTGIDHIVIPGVDITNWDRITELCEQNNNLSACYGLHPYRVEQHQPEHLDAMRQRLATHDCIAVGECGLDYREGMADRELQQFYFTQQLEIAAEFDLPVVIHSVKATQQVIDTLKTFTGLTGMVHSYSGSYEQAVQLHDLGFRLSFGGAITYERATRLRDVIARLPLTAIMVETDAPDQPDASHVQERNEPAYITTVIDTIDELRDEERATIESQLYANALSVFDIE